MGNPMYKSIKFAVAISIVAVSAAISPVSLNLAHAKMKVPDVLVVQELNQLSQLPVLKVKSVHRKKNTVAFLVKCIKPDDKDGVDELYFELRDHNGQPIFQTARKNMEVDDTWSIEIEDTTYNGGTFALIESGYTAFGDQLIGFYKHKYSTTSAKYTKRMDGGRSLYEVSIEVRP